MDYKITFAKRAEKDYELVKRSPLAKKAKKILSDIKKDPYAPPLEELSGNLKGAYSKRLNLKHRIVYEIFDSERAVKILSMWTHYENI